MADLQKYKINGANSGPRGIKTDWPVRSGEYNGLIDAIGTHEDYVISGTCEPIVDLNTTQAQTSEAFVTPSYQLVATDGVVGHETFRLTLTLNAAASNIYQIYGNAANPMDFPAGFQEDAPFGANVGGVNPAFFPISASSEFDSWLTIGITEGDGGGALSTIGMDLNSWTNAVALSENNGGVFWMNPDDGPAVSAVVAQITVPTGTIFDVRLNAQGRSTTGRDWYQEDIQITNGAAYTPQSPLPSGRVSTNDNADTDSSGLVDVTDLTNVLGQYGGGAGTEDIDESGLVDIFDVRLVLANFGLTTPTVPTYIDSGVASINLIRKLGENVIVPLDCLPGTTGLTETLTFGGGASGEVATITYTNGLVTGRTLVP